MDHTGALQKHFAIDLTSTAVGFRSPNQLELVQDPATKEWMAFRWSEWNRALAVISLSSSAAGSRPVSLGKSDLKFSKPMLTDDGQVYMSDIELILDNSQLGARLLLNIYRITGRMP